MKSKFFNVNLTPDLINGVVGTMIQSDKTDLPFSARDILFDWQAVDVPRGANMLRSVSAYVMGEDGGLAANQAIYLIFAKTINNVAPTTLGVVNAAVTAGWDLPLHYIGAMKLSGAGGEGAISGPTFGNIMVSTMGMDDGAQAGWGLPMVLDLEPTSGTNVGYDKLYVAGIAGGAFDFSTGVLANYTSGAPSVDTTTSITVDTVDARKCFQVGDVIYVHDVNTALGTVKSVAENTITLEANNAAAVANNDEIVNANPIKIRLGFEY